MSPAETDSGRPGARTRAALIRAAAEIFERDGYTSANLHDVCARAAVTKGALYCHFPSKCALAAAVVERSSALWHETRRRLAGPDTEAGAQVLVDFTFEVVRAVRADPVGRVGNRLLLQADLFDVVAASQFVGWVAVVRDLLGRAWRAGELASGVRLGPAAEGIVAELVGVQLLAQAATGQRDLDERMVSMWRQRLPGLAAPGVRLRVGPPQRPG